MSDQINRDISRWSEEKLEQWCKDSIMRFAIANDGDDRDAFSHTCSVLMVSIASLIAHNTEIRPEMAGVHLAKIIHHIRNRHDSATAEELPAFQAQCNAARRKE